MTVHILTDSSHYLDPAVIAQLNLQVLPLSLHLNQHDFREREEITTEALFGMLSDKTSSWPTTAAVTPGALQAAFDALTAGGGEVVGIFMSRGTSITVENAQNAAAIHPAHDRIRVVDSRVISGALALTLHTAGRLAQSGATAAQIASVAWHMGEAMRVMFTVDTLDYLHRGGRMKGSQALLGSLLGIKPVLWLTRDTSSCGAGRAARRRRWPSCWTNASRPCRRASRSTPSSSTRLRPTTPRKWPPRCATACPSRSSIAPSKAPWSPHTSGPAAWRWRSARRARRGNESQQPLIR